MPNDENNTQTILEELQNFLKEFEKELQREDLRKKVNALIPAYDSIQALGISLMPPELVNNAKDRILYYFQKYPKQVINRKELMVVSGIEDWARRVRELRTEQGWNILSGVTVREMLSVGDEVVYGQALSMMKPDDYILVSTEQDRDAAYRWKLAHTIRNEKLSVKDKILKYFRANAGKQVTGEELMYVAKDKTEWARRVRELRTEEGWPIVTRNTGRPDLPVGVYVLEADRQMPVQDRSISDEVRISVLIRDKFRCTNPNCHWDRSQWQKDDPRQFLELHHITYHINSGSNDANNLITLCNVCHDRVHAGRLELNWLE